MLGTTLFVILETQSPWLKLNVSNKDMLYALQQLTVPALHVGNDS